MRRLNLSSFPRWTYLASFLLSCSSIRQVDAVWTDDIASEPDSVWTTDDESGVQWVVGNDRRFLYAGSVTAPRPRPYYLRFVVHDRPGILASIAAALAGQGINLDAVLQQPGYPKNALPFVITVEACEEASLRAALDDIARFEFHAEPPLSLPMLLGDDERP